MADAVVAPCRPEDLPAIVDLVNAAYRGTAGPVGWTSEVGYIDGTRTSLDDLKRDLAADTDPVLLTLRQAPDGEIAACALIERCHARDGAAAAYIGMVTVRPDLQAGGGGPTVVAGRGGLPPPTRRRPRPHDRGVDPPQPDRLV